ncbi:MAG: hypothetical protein EOO68_14490 [Moraxellaceae bacterium]|nr:MAG: hypothetical protein EOO68_14490 [Moraxellaceae bacterium]
MDEQQLEEVIACLPTHRTLFHYFKDQYAVYLLQHYLINATSNHIHNIKQSRMKKLLDKQVVKDSLKNSGNGMLESTQLENLWSTQTEQYVLTLGRWGHKSRYDWNQTSRPGVNLVLQLNLSNQFETMFKAITGCDVNRMTTCYHPKSTKRSATLAWARLDMDFNTGEVLIEEIQSDLIRDLESMHLRALRTDCGDDMRVYWSRQRLNREKMATYCAQVIAAQKKIWSEAMMAATLWFVHQELGFSNVYYHTFETGKVMKKINGSEPPRSLYTDLPEKFCFQITKKAPQFIVTDPKARRRLKAAEDPEWFLLTG